MESVAEEQEKSVNKVIIDIKIANLRYRAEYMKKKIFARRV